MTATSPTRRKRRKMRRPSLSQLRRWADRGLCPAAGCPHGCKIEHDGRCEHGYDSIMLKLGMV